MAKPGFFSLMILRPEWMREHFAHEAFRDVSAEFVCVVSRMNDSKIPISEFPIGPDAWGLR